MLELIKLLKNLTGKETNYFLKLETCRQEGLHLKISKADKKLGWKPEVSVEQGASKIVSWIQENI